MLSTQEAYALHFLDIPQAQRHPGLAITLTHMSLSADAIFAASISLL